jgi:thiosulfate reductase cytochrome b subunit
MTWRKVFGWALLAFAIFYLVTAPHSAAHFVHSAFSGLAAAAHSMTKFVNSL